MTTMLMEVEIYVEDTGLCKALIVKVPGVYTAIYLGKKESYEVADRLEAFVVDRRGREPFELKDGLDSLAIEEYKWMEVRIVLNGVRGVLDLQAVREIAHDLRCGWEVSE